MKTENELIAEFMGYEFVNDAPDQFPDGYYYLSDEGQYSGEHDWLIVKDMHYDESWDWLMPVVENIGGFFTPSDEDNEEPEISIQARHVTGLELDSHIQTVYKAVVDFIKFYNSKNS